MTRALDAALAATLRGADDTLVLQADAGALLALDADWAVLLSPDERERLQRFRAAAPATLFAAARVLLRCALGLWTGRDSAALRFEDNGHGKPVLPDAGAPHFNVSHSGSQVVLALDRHDPVGVDIEARGRSPDWRGIAPMVCSDAEIALLDSLDSPTAFLRIWTQKEAVAKALGLGLSAPMKGIGVHLDTDPVWHAVALPPGQPPVSSIELVDWAGLHGCLAVAGAARPFRTAQIA